MLNRTNGRGRVEIDCNGTLLNWQKLPFEGYEEAKYQQSFNKLKKMFNASLGGKNLNIRRYIDAGANYGLTVPIMHDRCENIECFEIRSDVFEYLEMNIINHGFSEKTRAHNAGLSNRKRFAWHDNNHNSGLTRVHKQYKLGRKKCSLVTLDSFNFQDVDLIKIDVEGHEHEVLKGSKKTIQYNRPICIVETKGVEKRKNVIDFFSSIDYSYKLWGWKDFICVPNEKDYD